MNPTALVEANGGVFLHSAETAKILHGLMCKTGSSCPETEVNRRAFRMHALSNAIWSAGLRKVVGEICERERGGEDMVHDLFDIPKDNSNHETSRRIREAFHKHLAPLFAPAISGMLSS